MWTYIHTDELYHHGIKGQKWGVRRFQNPDGSLTARGKKRANEQALKDNKAQKKTDVRNRGLLSDNDLKSKINRLQMEKQLRELTEGEIDRGRSKAKSVVSDIGITIVKGVATTAIKGAALYGIKVAIDKGSFTKKGLADAVFKGGAGKK